jgi:hypothetical protein
MGYAVALGANQTTLALSSNGRDAVLRIDLLNANAAAKAEGKELMDSVSNYYFGNNQALWRSGVKHYGRVLYRNVYPGIDLTYYGAAGKLEYDFVVGPGADPNQIRMNFEGMQNLKVNADGDLVATVGGQEVIQHRPVVYQQKKPVNGRFRLIGSNQVAFQVGAYDKSKALTIDPTVAFSTWIGGAAADNIYAVTSDAAGNIVVTGSTKSNDLFLLLQKYVLNADGTIKTQPSEKLKANIQNGPWQEFWNNDRRNDPLFAYLATLSAPGVVAPAGGLEAASNPTTADAFVAKLTSDGSKLVFITYLGGNTGDQGLAITTDASGNIWVGGNTNGTNNADPKWNFPTLGGGGSVRDQLYALKGGQGPTVGNPGTDGFVSEFNPAGVLLYSELVGGTITPSGGTGISSVDAITIDSANNVYVAGFTDAIDLPTNPSVYTSSPGPCPVYQCSLTFNTGVTGQPTSTNFYDAFVAKIVPGSLQLGWITYLGGSFNDFGGAIATDAAGNIYVAGLTTNADTSAAVLAGTNDFPVVLGVQPARNNAANAALPGTRDAFVAKFSANGQNLIYSAIVGGTADEGANVSFPYANSNYNNSSFGVGIAVDATGAAYLAVTTSSTDYPITTGAYQSKKLGGNSAAITKISPDGRSYVYSTYLGGSASDNLFGVALDSSKDVYVIGTTLSPDFPTTKGAPQATMAATAYNFLTYNTATKKWTGFNATPFINGAVNQLVADPATINPNTQPGVPWLYAAVGRGVLKSTDGGKTYKNMNGTGTNVITATTGAAGAGEIDAIAIDPSSCQNIVPSFQGTAQYACLTLYAGGAGSPGIVWKSVDGGNNWAQSALLPNPKEAVALSSSFVAPVIQALAVDPSNPLNIYAGTNVGVYRSSDGGMTYKEASNGMNRNSVGGTTGTSNPGSCVAGDTFALQTGTAIELEVCTNGPSNTWTPYRTQLVSINSIGIDPRNTSRVWVATNFGVWLSNNAGGSWTWVKILAVDPTTQLPSTYAAAPNVTTVEAAMSSIAVDATGIVWAARSGNALYYSPNYGTTWYTWPTAASFNPTSSSYDATKPWGAASIGSKAATNLVVDNTTTPPTIYLGTAGNGFYSWQCTSNCRGSLQLSPIDNQTPIALFTQSATSGINQGGVNYLAYNSLIGFQAGGTAPNAEAFVSELDPTGGKLVFSTYLGNTGGEDGWAIHVDSKGNIYAAGQTSSGENSASTFPATKGSYTTSRPGGRDGFVTVYKP